MSTIGNVNLHIGQNLGVISLGDGNTIDLGASGLPPDQAARVHAAVVAAVQAAKVGNAAPADGTAMTGDAARTDAAALKTTVQQSAPHDAAARRASVGRWLLKIAPAAAGVAGSLLTPAAGKLAEALADWVARQVGGDSA